MGFVLMLFMLAGLVNPLATPVATPSASPIAELPCDGIVKYFGDIGELLRANEGYVAVRVNPAGTFGLPSHETKRIARSLDELTADLDSIEPPGAAELFHIALIDQIGWYHQLVTATDLTTHQRIINRDKKLLPGMSRAMLAGQSACGYDVWNDAYNLAFGDDER